MPSARLGRHRGDGQAEARDLRGQVELQPLGHGRRQRGDDHLVEAVDVDRVLDRVHRRRVADHALDVAAGGLLQQRDRELEDLLGLAAVLILGVDDDVQAVRGVGHQQRELGVAAGGALPDGVEQGRGRRGLVRDHQHAGGTRGLHAGSSFRAVAHDVRTRGARRATRVSEPPRARWQNRFARLLGLKPLGEANVCSSPIPPPSSTASSPPPRTSSPSSRRRWPSTTSHARASRSSRPCSTPRATR